MYFCGKQCKRQRVIFVILFVSGGQVTMLIMHGVMFDVQTFTNQTLTNE